MLIDLGKILIHIPRFYSKNDFKNLDLSIPPDYETKSDEYWNYVEEKLNPFSKKIKRIYLEFIDKGKDEGLRLAEKILDDKGFRIVKKMINNGAELYATEDQKLIMETSSWGEMLRNESDFNAVMELYQDSLKERYNHMINVINETLKNEEMGIIIMESVHKIDFPSDTKVIRMCRFDPSDYLKSYIIYSKADHKKKTAHFP